MRASIISLTAITGTVLAAQQTPTASTTDSVVDPTTLVTKTATSSATSQPTSSTISLISVPAIPASCPADLNGDYQFPHLIVPISQSSPNTAFGTQYNATLNTDTSTIFNFDIPPAYAGRTCSLVFLFPSSSSSSGAYDFNARGGINAHALAAPADQGTTYASRPAVNGSVSVADISALEPGSAYVLHTAACEAGTRKGWELDAAGGLALEYFQDYSPPAPIGLYVRAC